MDDQAPALEAQNAPAVEDNSPTTSPVAEPTTSESTETVAQESTSVDTAAAEPVADAPVEAERQPTRAERRINQLTGQLKELTASQQTTTPIPQIPSQTTSLSDQIPTTTDEYGQQVVDTQALEQLVQSREQAVRGMNTLEVQQLRHELTQQRAVDEVEKEAAVLPNQYDELNPDSPKYIPALEDKIEAAYKARAVIQNPYNPSQRMINPSVKLSDVAKDFIDVARAAAEQGKALTTATLAQQQDTSAITPTSDAPEEEKPFADLPLAEQERILRAKGHQI